MSFVVIKYVLPNSHLKYSFSGKCIKIDKFDLISFSYFALLQRVLDNIFHKMLNKQRMFFLNAITIWWNLWEYVIMTPCSSYYQKPLETWSIEFRNQFLIKVPHTSYRVVGNKNFVNEYMLSMCWCWQKINELSGKMEVS